MTIEKTPPAGSALATTPTRRDGALAAVAGVVSGALALAVGSLVAAGVAPRADPFVAVGQAFIDLTPSWLKEAAINAFGTNDKLALLVGMGAVLVLLAAAGGLLALRRTRRGVVLVLALAVPAVVAALTRPGANALAPVPALAAVAIGALVLSRLVVVIRRSATPWATVTDTPGEPQTSGRRAVLALALAGAGAAILGGASRVVSAVTSAGRGPGDVRLPAAAAPAPDLPAGAQVDVPGTTPFVTATSGFYRIDTALVVPRVDAGTWRLRLHGMVERETELSYDQLIGMPLVERMVTMTCVSNEVGGTLAGNATWLGCPLAQLIQSARPRAGADMVLSTSVDGFTASTPLAALTDGRDALLAVAMNGAPLPAEHGFPVRMVVPGLYGYVSATKWLVDLEVTRFDQAQSYWTRRGWAQQAPIRTASRIDVPRPFAQVAAGRVAVAGVAWAQHRGIRGVQVRVDGGPWQNANLAADAGIDIWRQWSWAWDAQPGGHRLEVRATDASGAVQPGERRTPMPDGATGWHSVVVTVT